MKEYKQGFTLIEMIGVLAVMAILASVIAPKVIRQIQRARQDAEDEVLSRLAGSFEDYVLENRIIPPSGSGTGAWSTGIATQADLAPIDIYQNDMGCTRRYWFDPSTDLNGLDSAEYNQNTVAIASLSGYTIGSTASPPVNPRAMIISDVTPGCSSNINTPTSAADFASTWNQSSPALSEGETIKIQRINLAQILRP